MIKPKEPRKPYPPVKPHEPEKFVDSEIEIYSVHINEYDNSIYLLKDLISDINPNEMDEIRYSITCENKYGYYDSVEKVFTIKLFKIGKIENPRYEVLYKKYLEEIEEYNKYNKLYKKRLEQYNKDYKEYKIQNEKYTLEKSIERIEKDQSKLNELKKKLSELK